MLYKPSDTTPYLGAIDATLNNNFSCYINADGGTQVNKYNLTIKDLSGTQIYTTGDITPSPLLYNTDTLNVNIPNTSTMVNGIDYTWSIKLYEQNPTIWVTYGTVQTGSTTTSINLRKQFNVFAGMHLKINNVMRQITSYSSTTGVAVVATAFPTVPVAGVQYTVYTNNVISDNVYFKARKTPDVSISNFIATITNKSYTFNGSYTQTDGVNWKYYSWILYNNSGDVIKSEEQINTGEIKFIYDGFLSNTSYKIELIIETQDGIIVTTGKQQFNVSYAEPSLVNVASAENICSKDAFLVTWENPSINLYTVTGTYDYINDEPFLTATSLNLHSESALEYAISNSSGEVLIPYNSTSSMYCKFPDGAIGEFYRQTNSHDGSFYSITCNPRSFVYNINDHYIGTIDISHGNGWLLNEISDFDPLKIYVWDDNATWDDNMFWTESDGESLKNFSWKITLLPDSIKLKKDSY